MTPKDPLHRLYMFLYIHNTAANDVEGFITVRPGENITVPLELVNVDRGNNFDLRANAVSSTGTSDFFSFQLSHSSVFVNLNGRLEFNLQISLADDIVEGSVVTFIVTVEREDNMYDFMSVSMTATNMPLPQFTENVSSLPCQLVCLSVLGQGCKGYICCSIPSL